MTQVAGPNAEPSRTKRSYEIFILGLSLYAIVAFLAEAFIPMEDAAHRVLAYTDYGVCAVFLADFARSLRTAPNRLRYLVTWGWFDLVSSIPALPFARLARAARVARILRVLRSVRAGKTIALHASNRRAEGAAYVVAFVCLLLIVIGSAAVLHVESGPESHIRTAGDALWWSIVTLSTVGYGDLYPVTAEGRIIGVLLMTAGVALFGTLTGLLASWFLAPDRQAREDDTKAMRAELAALRALVESRLPPPKA